MLYIFPVKIVFTRLGNVTFDVLNLHTKSLLSKEEDGAVGVWNYTGGKGGGVKETFIDKFIFYIIWFSIVSAYLSLSCSSTFTHGATPS